MMVRSLTLCWWFSASALVSSASHHGSPFPTRYMTPKGSRFLVPNDHHNKDPHLSEKPTTKSTLLELRGGAVGPIPAETLILLKALSWGSNGIMAPAINVVETVYETDTLKDGTVSAYCAESFAWSILGVALLDYFADKMDVDKVLALSALPQLYLYYKDFLRGNYAKLGIGQTPVLMTLGLLIVVVASCLFQVGLDSDLASKILIAYTLYRCVIGAFLPEKGAASKGITLEPAEVKWWAWANKMPLEWAVMAVCLKKGVEASKAVGYSTLAWAALLAHQKAVGNDVVGKPIVSTIYLVFSVVVGTLLSF